MVKLEKNMELYKKARFVLSEVVSQTQKFFKKEVESLVTLFLKAVYGDRYKFIMEFGIERNKSVCKLLVQEKEYEPFVPKTSTGGGVLDVISVALKV
jgi:hypothetical protein